MNVKSKKDFFKIKNKGKYGIKFKMPKRSIREFEKYPKDVTSYNSE